MILQAIVEPGRLRCVMERLAELMERCMVLLAAQRAMPCLGRGRGRVCFRVELGIDPDTAEEVVGEVKRTFSECGVELEENEMAGAFWP